MQLGMATVRQVMQKQCCRNNRWFLVCSYTVMVDKDGSECEQRAPWCGLNNEQRRLLERDACSKTSLCFPLDGG